jgi:glycosyltransferase involved in cell wall biosynthesis
VTCHDDWPFLADQLRSLQAQTMQEFELVIVDDASSERRSVELRDALEAEAPAGAKLVCLPRNVGLAAARNRGIAEITAPYVACLDADDVLAPRFLERTAAVLDERPDVGFVYFDHFEFGDVRRHVRSRAFDAAELLEQNFVVAAAPFRRTALDDVGGGYLEEMSGGYEDWELWVRMARAGWRGHRIARTLFYYRKRPESLLAGTLRKHAEVAEFIRSRHSSAPLPPRRAPDGR